MPSLSARFPLPLLVAHRLVNLHRHQGACCLCPPPRPLLFFKRLRAPGLCLRIASLEVKAEDASAPFTLLT